MVLVQVLHFGIGRREYEGVVMHAVRLEMTSVLVSSLRH